MNSVETAPATPAESRSLEEQAAAISATLAPMSPPDRLRWVHTHYEKVLVSSSFGTTAAILLEAYHQAGLKHPVHFIDTGYHFPETLAYRQQLQQRYHLQLITTRGDAFLHQLTQQHRLWEKDPDACCSVNKTAPMSQVTQQYTVWVSGLMGWQSPTRKNIPFAEVKDGIIKIHPLVDLTEKQAEACFLEHRLPRHPLEHKGYASVGCTHCTQPGKKREGRWAGRAKTECGLHMPR